MRMTFTRYWLYLTLLCSFNVGIIDSYSDFVGKIPNGNKVPNPCSNDPVDFWFGVGHQSSGGADARNQFGIDFANADYSWTNSLCRLDSDGDGKTNGQELGDPDCTWIEGATPSRSNDISHPGICEPLDSQSCCQKQSWVTCHTACSKADNMAGNTEL